MYNAFVSHFPKAYPPFFVSSHNPIMFLLPIIYSSLKENIHTKKESTISVEAFVIPPLPENLVFMKEEKVQNSSIIYKSMSKRYLT